MECAKATGEGMKNLMTRDPWDGDVIYLAPPLLCAVPQWGCGNGVFWFYLFIFIYFLAGKSLLAFDYVFFVFVFFYGFFLVIEAHGARRSRKMLPNSV